MLIVVRHGQTNANARGVLLGHADPALDEVGIEQAKAVALKLSNLSADARIVSSPLLRTRETAAIIAGHDNIDVDPRWIELKYGELEGTPVDDVSEETWRRWRNDPTSRRKAARRCVRSGSASRKPATNSSRRRRTAT